MLVGNLVWLSCAVLNCVRLDWIGQCRVVLRCVGLGRAGLGCAVLDFESGWIMLSYAPLCWVFGRLSSGRGHCFSRVGQEDFSEGVHLVRVSKLEDQAALLGRKKSWIALCFCPLGCCGCL